MKYIIYSLIVLVLLVSAKSDKTYYNEKYRPQIHFSPEKDWLFEPSGFVFYLGEYHLFYQNVSIDKKLLTNRLGHAVSKDLVHWEHRPFAFVPDEKATDVTTCRPMAGSAVIDSMNVTGLRQNGAGAMLIFYSDSQGNQNIAYSTDKGSTWNKYAKNPVISSTGAKDQDPKVFFHKPTGKWILAMYRAKGEDGKTPGISFYNSSDLLQWQFQSHIGDTGECPDIFEIGVDGNSTERKWVLISGEGEYKIGSFDGIAFKPETETKKLDLGKNFFSAQTLSNAPDGKVILIAWMRGGEYPDMPFNGQMSFPTELSLRSIRNGLVLCRKPVSSISTLFDHDLLKKDKNLIPGIKGNLLSGITGDAVFIRAVLQPKSSDRFGIIVRNGKKSEGTDIQYDSAKKILFVNGEKMILEPIAGKIELEIILDRSSIEVFGNNGEAGISTCFSPASEEEEITLYTQGGELFVELLEAYTLNTAWKKK
jgi:sucrose-6-phosphate hydrolase SacC (GH32 family)